MAKSLNVQSFAFALVCLIIPFTSVAQKKKGKRARTKWDVQTVEKRDQICFAMYTVHDGTLKMSVQLYPLAADDSRTVVLEIMKAGTWNKVATSKVRENDYGSPKGAKAWNTLLRAENWDTKVTYKYRVVALDGVATYEGTIRKDPIDKNEIVVAAFTGNSCFDRSLKPDIIKNVKTHDPDLLFFSGDQSYDHRNHLGAWLHFGRQYGEIIKDRPTICIPDDHDVGQGNIWGAEGKAAKLRGGADGGYVMPPKYVKEVEFAQTANLPDPYDPTPIQRGIGVYYTSLAVGGIDFAIIEDRKFKSGPAGLVPKQGPRPDHIRNPKYDPKSVDVKGAKLLGERQLKFLNAWSQDWNGVEMKTVLSATVFCNAAHIHGSPKNRLHADMDSNGWPQTGRNKAVGAIRKGFAFMLAGDQHLATVVHHGIDDFRDSGYSFCVPSIVNYYTRWWKPEKSPLRRIQSPLEHTGDYHDGFMNKVTMYAYANPGEHNAITTSKLVARVAGHGIVRFDKSKRTITMECWPRGSDVNDPKAKQYPGWPITITQEDNYGRKATAFLPTLTVIGTTDPVIQVIDESNAEIVYTLRIKGTTWTPKVFSAGTYTLKVNDKTFKGVTATKTPGKLKISF